MSTTPDELSVTPTGQQSATDSAELAFQPGYWLPWEQADPTQHGPAAYVDYTNEPIAHVEWRQERSEINKESQEKARQAK